MFDNIFNFVYIFEIHLRPSHHYYKLFEHISAARPNIMYEQTQSYNFD